MSDQQAETVYLIDASAYVYRAFFALPDLSTSRGLPTNALYGFITMLQKLLREHAPAYVAAVMDRPEPTFRHKSYPDYKANRAQMPDNLALQLPHIREVLEAFSIAVVEKAGYEADDVIGTLAMQAAADGARVVIVSGDKDMCQLVGPQITMLDTMKGRTVDAAAVAETYGLPPDKMIDYFSLTGDSSDNIPGVAGVGPKTAQSLIAQYGSLDELYRNLASIGRKKLQQTLIEQREAAFVSRRLVTIDTAVPLDMGWRDLKAVRPDHEALRRLFKTFEFTRQLKALEADERPDKNYRVLTGPDEIRRLFSELRARGAFTLDLETTSEQPMLAEIVGLSFAWRDHEAWYIPLRHRGVANQPNPEWVLAELKPLLEDASIAKTGHNIKYEYIIFKRCGIDLRGIACDTMVASYVLNPSKYRHNLDDVALDYLDYRTISFKDVAGSGAKAVTFDHVALEAAAEYACEDSDITGMLSRLLMPRIEQEGFGELYHVIEMPLVRILGDMEMAGVRLDLGLLQQLSQEFGRELAGIEAGIYDLAGQEFKINSPKQLGAVLFEKLGLPARKKTKTGYATDVDVLNELGHLHPLPAQVLAYRSLAKLISTYIDSIPRLVNPATGRIHTSYNQTVTATGRLSSSDPNLQNIPIRTGEGRRIREAFITEPGWKLLSADYSQIELRILAHLAGDAVLIEAFRQDQDIHARTAAEIWGVGPEQVTDRMRRDAKVINFGIIYGMSAYGLSQELGIAPPVAQSYIDGYFSRYSGVRVYLDGVLEQARRHGYVETLMRRRRYLPDIQAANQAVRKFAERTAINAPIQGTAADLIKIAMIAIDRALQAGGLKARMIMQVHDELVFEAPEGDLPALAALVRREMEAACDLRVPLKVDINWGDTWREAH